MDLRLTFNEDVQNYDRMRPTYVKALHDDVIRFCDLGCGKAALEIGIGTGQATVPFLNTGCKVTAVEIGKNMAAYSKEKFSGYPNFDIINCDFESADFGDGAFDLIYSATAFHWIPEEAGYPKAHRLLKPGGTLALFWNHPSRPDDDLDAAMQKAYDKHMPSSQPKSPVHGFNDANCARIVRTLQQYGFVDAEYHIYRQTRMFDADGYIALLNTYSDHRALPIDKWLALEEELRAAIGNNGGQIDIHDTMDLYLSRKPDSY